MLYRHCKDKWESRTLEKGREAVNMFLPCYSSGRRWQKSQIHRRVYILLTTEIHFAEMSTICDSPCGENTHIYMVLFIQRIPRYFIIYKYERSLCNVPNVLHIRNPVPNSPNLHPQQHWIFKHFYQHTIFCLWKNPLYPKKSAIYTICLLTYAASLLPTSLPPLTWKVKSIRLKTKSNLH